MGKHKRRRYGVVPHFFAVLVLVLVLLKSIYYSLVKFEITGG